MRYKVAKTKFEIQKYVNGEEYTEDGFLVIGKHINAAEPSNNEKTEEEGFLDGDGTPETDVTSIAIGYNFSGYRNYEDPAQNLIADMEFSVGYERKVWFRRTLPNGTVHVGRATVTEPNVSGGEATAYDQFDVTVTWDKKPEKVEETPRG